MLTITDVVTVADGVGWDHMNGWGWGGMGLGWLMMIGFVFLIIWLVPGSNTTTTQQPSAQDILAERFARGEITGEEYRERRDVLIPSRKRYGK